MSRACSLAIPHQHNSYRSNSTPPIFSIDTPHSLFPIVFTRLYCYILNFLQELLDELVTIPTCCRVLVAPATFEHLNLAAFIIYRQCLYPIYPVTKRYPWCLSHTDLHRFQILYRFRLQKLNRLSTFKVCLSFKSSTYVLV